MVLLAIERSMSTRISIVIPTHRRPKLLRRALKSALAFCGSVDEILVVSDHDSSARHSLSDIVDHRVRVLENNEQRGASATRNAGITSSTGHTVLFLDDDDELLSGYISRILTSVDHHDAKWGFANQLTRWSETDAPQPDVKHLLPRGFVGSNFPFRRKIGALGAGFWVRRELLTSLGAFCAEQFVDEDVDLCCRLIADGNLPWFEPEPATIVDRDATIPRLTSIDSAQRNAECYLRTFKRNYRTLKNEAEAEAFLAIRAQRMILRSGNKELLDALLNENLSVSVRAKLWGKRLVGKLRKQ